MTDKKCVLVVEDDLDIREGLRDVLELEGYRVELAANGREGLEKVEEHRPAVIVLDWMMPHLGGGEFTAALRKREGPTAKTPIVLLTAAGEAMTKATQVEAVVAKPIDLERLFQILAQFA